MQQVVLVIPYRILIVPSVVTRALGHHVQRATCLTLLAFRTALRHDDVRSLDIAADNALHRELFARVARRLPRLLPFELVCSRLLAVRRFLAFPSLFVRGWGFYLAQA